MKHIIVGTNRKGSRSRQIAEIIQGLYQEHGETVELIDLASLDLGALGPDSYDSPLPESIAKAVDKVNTSEGLIIVVPEYNGSYPGALKYFIDFWSYPKSFENRPVCFVGLGGAFGGLRPVEHLQGVFGYRNAFIFPQRVFLQGIWNILKDGRLDAPKLMDLLRAQTAGFIKFVKGLEQQGLDANTVNSQRPEKK